MKSLNAKARWQWPVSRVLHRPSRFLVRIISIEDSRSAPQRPGPTCRATLAAQHRQSQCYSTKRNMDVAGLPLLTKVLLTPATTCKLLHPSCTNRHVYKSIGNWHCVRAATRRWSRDEKQAALPTRSTVSLWGVGIPTAHAHACGVHDKSMVRRGDGRRACDSGTDAPSPCAAHLLTS